MPLAATVRHLSTLAYAVYAWFVLLFAALPVAAACLLLPGLARRRVVAHRGAAAFFRLIGSPIAVIGERPGPGDQAIVVANHQSYLDGMILTAALPPQFTFLIKGEMARVPIAGFVLRRLGSEFVDRSDSSNRQRSARRLVRAASQGRALAVFPEGTFDEKPGLKSFHMGAFRAAFRAGLPVIPVTITGARAKLPSASWLPRPGPIAVEFRPQINAGDCADQAALMQATRQAILERLGEPDLDQNAPPAPTTTEAE